jgi:hypothetical protein
MVKACTFLQFLHQIIAALHSISRSDINLYHMRTESNSIRLLGFMEDPWTVGLCICHDAWMIKVKSMPNIHNFKYYNKIK